MAASTTQNPSSRSESKSAKKKKAAKSESAAASTASVPAPEIAPAASVPESASGDGSYESPYIKELYKSIRNVNKKIANASKVDNILAENPDMSLDALVAARKINADQKAQILKRPSLQASLNHLEEQIAQYKKFDLEYKTRSQAEKAEFEKAHTERHEMQLAEAVAVAKAKAAGEAIKEQQSNLLLLSQFLRLAAARRAEEADSSLDENQALEGVLLSVYSGDESAVATMLKLINGSNDGTHAVTGEKLETTYAQVKAASLAHAPAVLSVEATSEDTSVAPAVETTEYPAQSDPTIAHATLNELEDQAATSLANGHDDANAATPTTIPQNSGIDEGAANAAAESHWDANADLSASQEWVDVSLIRDASETETGLTATIAAPSNTQGWVASNNQSWADDQPESPKAEVLSGNDGFHEVQRTRGGRDRDGQFRGRGGRGGDRGRGGFRGNDGGYRGRGRGGPRGGGPPRGRRPDEA